MMLSIQVTIIAGKNDHRIVELSACFKGFKEAPKGVVLETLDELRRYRAQIEAQAVRNKSMPLGNETQMTDEERAKLGAWLVAQ